MAKNKDIRIGYVCGVDFQHELGEANDVVIYSSIEALKTNRSCWTSCGIVKLEISVKSWVEKQNLSEK